MFDDIDFSDPEPYAISFAFAMIFIAMFWLVPTWKTMPGTRILLSVLAWPVCFIGALFAFNKD